MQRQRDDGERMRVNEGRNYRGEREWLRVEVLMESLRRDRGGAMEGPR